MSRLPTRRMRTGSSALSQIEIRRWQMAARVSECITRRRRSPAPEAPGPAAGQSPCARRSRKKSSPWSAKISLIDLAATFSISSSASMKGKAELAASRLPTDDLPQPIRPTSTMLRRPRRALISSTTSLSNIVLARQASFGYVRNSLGRADGTGTGRPGAQPHAMISFALQISPLFQAIGRAKVLNTVALVQ